MISDIIASWKSCDSSVNSTASIIDWINHLNQTTYVNIQECSIDNSDTWFYDEERATVRNKKGSFFSIKGMQYYVDNQLVLEQPVIMQPEIGYLGIICQKIDGVLHFLMQAKIEPGNVNCVQISPTIQATKSNFTRSHGGKEPAYFTYFKNSAQYEVIYDQIQSEQAARFYKKRNRNMIMLVEDEIPLLPNFKWMTLGQIKKLMEIDNLVNMDTRTVLAGIPFCTHKCSEKQLQEIEQMFSDKSLYHSIFTADPGEGLIDVFQAMNNYKMFCDTATAVVPLSKLADWHVDEYGITCNHESPFLVRYYDIEIAGREVRRWTQPLFKAIGMATFGLITKQEQGVRKFLVRIKPEIGCFDKLELGPSIQWEPTQTESDDNAVDRMFRRMLEQDEEKMCDVILSEEGGRFYHEQNRNVIMDVSEKNFECSVDGYYWVTYSTLNYLIQVNNCMNIQLRNLLSLLKL